MSRRQSQNTRNGNDVSASPDERRRQLCEILTEALELAQQLEALELAQPLEDPNSSSMDPSNSSSPELDETSSSMLTIGDDMAAFAPFSEPEEEAKQSKNSKEESGLEDKSHPTDPTRKPEWRAWLSTDKCKVFDGTAPFSCTRSNPAVDWHACLFEFL